MAEYLARVTWEIIRRYREELRKIDGAGECSRRLALTDQYGSDQPALNKLEFGDGLWLFTAPVFGSGVHRRTLPPSVLGRISITHQWSKRAPNIQLAVGAPSSTAAMHDTHIRDVAKDYRYWRSGIPGEVLPIHNAFSLLKSLTFQGRVKRVDATCKRCNLSYVPQKGPFGHLMQHFQSIRTLTADSATRLHKLHDHVAARRTLFLSHRHHEAGSLVKEVAKHLQDHALCWWDVQELPQSRRYADKILQDILNDGIRQAGWFIAFLTPGYSSTRWTEDEWKEARALCAQPGLARRPKILPVLQGGDLREGMEGQRPIRLGDDSKAIAAAIRERIESIT